MATANKLTKYVVITPVRDEEQHIESTIHCMLGQTLRPLEWIIVDDGSTDRTGSIIERYSRQNSWIRAVYRKNRGFRQSGGGVVEAFYDGLRNLQEKNWHFIVKLDGDLGFNPNYFEALLAIFANQPRLGIAGGTLYYQFKNNWIQEKCPRFHVRGATKVYRRECWEDIGGLQRAPGWDIVDEVKANMMGWNTGSFPKLQMIHHRFTGTAESKLKDMVKNGKAYYFAGYHPMFMAAKCAYRAISRPYVFGSLAMAYGFISSYVKRVPQIPDRALIKYVRRQQVRRLLGAESIWK